MNQITEELKKEGGQINGDYYKMIAMPIGDYAQKYCIEAGLYVGCICEVANKDKIDVVLQKTDLTINSDPFVIVGIEFFKEYFRKDLRFKNLEKLGI